MQAKNLLLILGIAFVVMFAGCAKYHATSASLLVVKRDKTETKTDYIKEKNLISNDELYVGNNPIYLHGDTVFSVELKQVYPGWVHQNANNTRVAPEDSTWKRSAARQLKNRDLWVLVSIQSLSNQDPLELKTKKYFTASNVKLESESFALIPLDEKESIVFTHIVDGSYRMNIKVYEIKAFELKQALLWLKQENPGIVDVVQTGVDALGGTVKSLLGHTLFKWLEQKNEEPLFFERILMELGGVIQFHATVLFLKNNQMAEFKGLKLEVDTKQYYLYDYYKSKIRDGVRPGVGPHNDLSFNNLKTYSEEQTLTRAPVKFNSDSSYIQFDVVSVPAPQNLGGIMGSGVLATMGNSTLKGSSVRNSLLDQARRLSAALSAYQSSIDGGAFNNTSTPIREEATAYAASTATTLSALQQAITTLRDTHNNAALLSPALDSLRSVVVQSGGDCKKDSKECLPFDAALNGALIFMENNANKKNYETLIKQYLDKTLTAKALLGALDEQYTREFGGYGEKESAMDLALKTIAISLEQLKKSCENKAYDEQNAKILDQAVGKFNLCLLPPERKPINWEDLKQIYKRMD